MGRSLSGHVDLSGSGVQVIPFDDATDEPAGWTGDEDEDMPIPDPNTWRIVRARNGPPKAGGGMVELQSVTGDVNFSVSRRNSWGWMLGMAKQVGRAWLRKVGCDLWKEEEQTRGWEGMRNVGVQTEYEVVEDVSLGSKKVEAGKSEEVKGEEKSAGAGVGKTLVETEAGMGKPTEIVDEGRRE